MAIQKTCNLPNGTQGNYWKITNITFDRIGLVVIYSISLFLDKARGTGNSAKSLGKTKQYTFTITKEESITNLISLGYTKIKEKAESMVRTPFSSDTTLHQFDSDLADGEDV